jgi:hypothetical protein
MGKFTDLIGFRFGRLLVLSRKENSKNNKITWECLCDCGKKKTILGASLLNERTVSCGCYSKEATRNSNLIDISNIKFGRLLAQKFVEIRKNKAYWECICDCGNIVEVNVGGLQSGNTKSCGCYNKDSLISRKINLIGRVFGNLTVLKESGRDNNNKIMWSCGCSCGNIVIVRGNHLVRGMIVSCGCNKESIIASKLKEYFKNNHQSISEYRVFVNPKTKYTLPYDIYIPENKIFIEINGVQHYEFIEFFHKTKDGFLKMKNHDKMKKNYAMKNGRYITIDLRKKEDLSSIISRIEKIIKSS